MLPTTEPTNTDAPDSLELLLLSESKRKAICVIMKLTDRECDLLNKALDDYMGK